MGRSIVYSLLERPWVYALSQAVLAPGSHRLEERHLGAMYRASAGRVLEVGCGLEPMTGVQQGVLVGLDINPDYVAQYAGGTVDTDPELIHHVPPGRSRLGYVGSADNLPFADHSFDEVRSRGLLHHLSAPVAARAVQEMWRCLRPEGRLFILDNVWPQSSLARPLAWLIRKLDRGEFIRSETELVALVRAASTDQCQYFRYTYTYNGLEGLCITATRPRPA